MKKLLFLFLFAGISSVLLFTGCAKDEDTPEGDPSINFISQAGFISQDETLPVSSSFKVKVAAFMNPDTEEKLTALKILRTFTQAARADWDTTLSLDKEESIQYEISFTAANIPGDEELEFQIIDENSRSSAVALTITTVPDIASYQMKILGSWDNPLGSSFASIDGTVYTQQQAFENQAMVDFLYWWGASTSATIGAPDDANANLVFTNPVNGLPQWTTKNATRFSTTTLTSNDFDLIATSDEIMNFIGTPTETRIPSLSVDDVIGFETVSGRAGLIRVVDIVTGSDGQITIDVKVEEE
jgi:hypothetical protein